MVINVSIHQVSTRSENIELYFFIALSVNSLVSFNNPYLVVARYCPQPAAPSSNGGFHDWIPAIPGGLPPYAHQIKYKCGVARILEKTWEVSPGVTNSSQHQEQIFACQWNQTYSPFGEEV